MPRKLVFVLPPDRDRPTGGNLYNRRLIEALLALGHEVEIIGSQTLRYDPAEEPDAVVIDSVLLAQVPDLIARLKSRARRALLVHHLPSFEPGASRAEALAREHRLLADVPLLLAPSAFARDELEQSFGPEKAIAVVPPALAVTPRGNRPHCDGFKALVVSNLIAIKGILPLLEALDRELGPEDEFHLEVVGRQDLEPGYAARCRGLVASGNEIRDRITLSQAVEPSAMERLYERSSVLVSASRAETFGMALQEARAFGLPILALEAGNVPNHIPSSSSGRLYRSIEELARDCLRLARDRKQFEDLKEAAWKAKQIPEWSWSDAAERFVRALCQPAKQAEAVGPSDN